MTLPTYDQFIEPLLRVLADHPEGLSAGAAHDAVANLVGLSDAEKAERLPSDRQAVYKNRIGWAHDRLKRNGLSTSPRRGYWQLTQDGRAYAARVHTLSAEELTRIASNDTPISQGLSNNASASLAPSASHASPEERIEAALVELRASVGRDLLENIMASSPEFFERLVLDLLHRMGYGTDQTSLQKVGGSGDGGIDGIISLDRLGLEKVYVQAKRWKNSVGSPDVQGFMGALQLQGASKGVFLTTSTFTKDAREAAKRARGALVLVDGEQLTALMIEHGVAVSHKIRHIPRIDSDYFEDT